MNQFLPPTSAVNSTALAAVVGLKEISDSKKSVRSVSSLQRPWREKLPQDSPPKQPTRGRIPIGLYITARGSSSDASGPASLGHDGCIPCFAHVSCKPEFLPCRRSFEQLDVPTSSYFQSLEMSKQEQCCSYNRNSTVEV